MKKIFFTFLIVVITCQSFAQIKKQKAILLFKDGKELTCFARVAGKNIRYTENDIHESEKVVDEKNILGVKIYINEKLIELHYKQEEGKDKFKLMELILNGKLKLYRFQEAYFKENNTFIEIYFFPYAADTKISRYFVSSKTNRDQVLRFHQDFEEEARIYFSDCKVLVDKIGQDRFRRKDIMNIVLFYNENCGK